MRVYINTFELTGSDTRGLVAGFTISGALIPEVASHLRAESVTVYNRRNASTSISFSVTRRHASPAVAEDFILRHATDIPEQGLVRLVAGDRTERYLYNAMAQAVESSYVGLTTRHRYQIIGGKIMKERPK